MRIPKSLFKLSFKSYFDYGNRDQDTDDALPA